MERALAVGDDDLQRARDRFAAWLRWYLEMYPAEANSQNALARRLGISGSTLTYLLEAGSTRSPSFETLLAASKVLRLNVDVLLSTDPPPLPQARNMTAKKSELADDWPISAQT